jgi:hypothetical protein
MNTTDTHCDNDGDIVCFSSSKERILNTLNRARPTPVLMRMCGPTFIKSFLSSTLFKTTFFLIYFSVAEFTQRPRPVRLCICTHPYSSLCLTPPHPRGDVIDRWPRQPAHSIPTPGSKKLNSSSDSNIGLQSAMSAPLIRHGRFRCEVSNTDQIWVFAHKALTWQTTEGNWTQRVSGLSFGLRHVASNGGRSVKGGLERTW